MLSLGTHYIAENEYDDFVNCHPDENILLCVGFNSNKIDNQPLIPQGHKFRSSRQATQLSFNVELSQLKKQNTLELWTSPGNIKYGVEGNIRFSLMDDLLMGAVAVEINGEINQFINSIYKEIIDFLGNQKMPVLVRMWNYFPDINGAENNVERYQQFCSGRYQAFEQKTQNFQSELPAATAIGTKGDLLTIYFLAVNDSVHAIENQRQLSAFKYPKQYGNHSPSFARASLKQWNENSADLYISGTASIVGHESQHLADCHLQLQEIIRNIAALIDQEVLLAKGISKALINSLQLNFVKVYLKEEKLLALAEQVINEETDWQGRVMFLKGSICRQELLIEVEGIWHMDIGLNP